MTTEAIRAGLAGLGARRIGRAAALVASVVVLAACSSGPSASPLPVPSGAVVVRAVQNRFEPATLTAPSGTFTLYFDNADMLPHNIVLLAPDGSRSLAGDVFTGRGQRTYAVDALASGIYRLHCDVHPEMSGDLTVP